MSSLGSLFTRLVTAGLIVLTGRRVGVVAFGALGVSSCGGDTRPPYIDDRANSEALDAAIEDEIIVPAPVNSGDGACETIVDLPVVKPNFYFVIDASGSMVQPLPGETISRYTSASRAIKDMLTGVRTRVNFGAALFPNPSDGASCSAGTEVFALSDRKQSNQGKSLEAMLTTLAQYTPEGGSPVSATLAAIQPKLLALDGPTYVFLLSDGAPNCNLELTCDVDQCIPNIEGLSFTNGIRCDEETNCCQPGWLAHLCLDESATDHELRTLRAANIPTYVIGMPGSITYADVLGRMASAGGTAREEGKLLYYQVNDAPDLAATLAALGQEILVDCKLALDFAPSSPDLVHVYAADEEIPTAGWQLTDERTVELLGETCDQWKTGKLPELRVRQTCTPVLR
jgi:hypothetical protein